MATQAEKSFPFASLTYDIIAAFFDVFRELGHGFSEIVYTRALAIVLLERGFEISVEHEIPVRFHGEIIGTFRADIVVNGTIVVEVKAAESIENYAVAQTLNYLKAAGGGVGLLLNFGRKADYKRLVMGDDPANSLPLLRRATTSAAAGAQGSVGS